MAASQVVQDMNDILKGYDPSKNKTSNILTKYEKVKIIGIRAEQIQRGAVPYVPVEEPFDARAIAKQELKEGKIPFMISRTLPNGAIEYWRLDDMLIF